MKDPIRHAFFIQQLARKLTEEQLWEMIKGAQNAMGYGDKQNPEPQLSKMQADLCDWLCQDGYREAADERLTRDAAEAHRVAEEARSKVYDATRGFEQVRKQTGALRRHGEVITEQLAEFIKLLETVPEPERR